MFGFRFLGDESIHTYCSPKTWTIDIPFISSIAARRICPHLHFNLSVFESNVVFCRERLFGNIVPL